MLLALKARLKPGEEQRRSLLKTMERLNAACNHISRAAFSSKTYKVKLQRLLYYDYSNAWPAATRRTPTLTPLKILSRGPPSIGL